MQAGTARQCLPYELKAPKGYQKTDEIFKVSISENGEIVELEIGNDKLPQKPVRPSSPNTGDDSNIALYVAAIALCIVGLALLTLKTRKERMNKRK